MRRLVWGIRARSRPATHYHNCAWCGRSLPVINGNLCGGDCSSNWSDWNYLIRQNAARVANRQPAYSRCQNCGRNAVIDPEIGCPSCGYNHAQRVSEESDRQRREELGRGDGVPRCIYCGVSFRTGVERTRCRNCDMEFRRRARIPQEGERIPRPAAPPPTVARPLSALVPLESQRPAPVPLSWASARPPAEPEPFF